MRRLLLVTIAMGLAIIVLAAMTLAFTATPATAHPHGYYHHQHASPWAREGPGRGYRDEGWGHRGWGRHAHQRAAYGGNAGRPADCYGIAWCGCWLARALGLSNPALNLAANWAHWGRPAGGPHVGAVVVWPHHVGRIVGGSNGHWLIQSGNDGNAVRTRYRSVANAIAFRVG
jgi:hypothetical protein